MAVAATEAVTTTVPAPVMVRVEPDRVAGPVTLYVGTTPEVDTALKLIGAAP